MTPKRHCILHIGTMKTGTTAIQGWLQDNTSWLKKNGWIYPGWPFRDDANILEVSKLSEPDNNLIISDEGLWHFAQTARSNTKKISEHLRDFKVTIIAYFRRPDIFLESWFKQGLKYGSGEHDLARFLSLPVTGSKNFQEKLELFISTFGEDNIILAPYERSQLKNGDIVADFLERTQLPAPMQEDSEKPNKKRSRNISPTADTMLMAGLMRKVFNARQEDINQLMRNTPVSSLLEARTRIMTSDEAQKVRDDYRPIFQSIQKRFGTGTTPDFFEDWCDDDPNSQVSLLRNAYNQYMDKYT